MKIEKLPSKSYRARVYLGKDRTGKKKWKSITGPDRNAVKREAKEYELHSSGANTGTFGQAMEEYIALRTPSLSPSTINSYHAIEKTLMDLCPWFFSMSLYAITRKELQEVVNALVGDKKGPKTVANYMSLVSSTLRAKNVILGQITMPKKKEQTIAVPTKEEVAKILKLARGTVLEIPFMLAATAGLRRGEVCALTWDDFDFKKGILHVHRGIVIGVDRQWHIKAPKTNASDRYITLPEEVLERIKQIGELPTMKPDMLTHHVMRFMQRNGFPYHFHSLRHFCASYMHSIGIPDSYIMQRCGWENDRILKQVYRHTLADQEKIYAEKANNAMAFLGKS